MTRVDVPDAEVKTYDTGHFAVYLPPWFELALADQLEFLRRRVPVAG